MNAAAIVSKAKALGVRLSLNGDQVKLRGPADAIAALKPEIAAHKPDVMAYLLESANAPAPLPADCIGALRAAGGGLYLPWGPYLSPDDVCRIRAELVGAIEALADMERWTADHRDDVLTRAIRSPLADLLPNLAHFNERLQETRATAAAREAVSRRAWRFDR